jgi:uncharacterized protein
MNFDIREFDSFPAEFIADVEADSREYEIEGVSFKDVMSVRIDIQKVGEEFYCHGFVSVPIEQECSRCLNPFDGELSGDLSFIIKTSDAKIPQKGMEEEDIIYVRANKPVVDLNEIIRESLILSLPSKPLCNEDCKGLCPNCGVNLNEESCECRGGEADERWEGLRDLLE